MRQRHQQVWKAFHEGVPWRGQARVMHTDHTTQDRDQWVSGFWATGVRSSLFPLAKFLSASFQHLWKGFTFPSMHGLNITSSRKSFLMFQVEETSLSLGLPLSITLFTGRLDDRAACALHNLANHMWQLCQYICRYECTTYFPLVLKQLEGTILIGSIYVFPFVTKTCHWIDNLIVLVWIWNVNDLFREKKIKKSYIYIFLENRWELVSSVFWTLFRYGKSERLTQLYAVNLSSLGRFLFKISEFALCCLGTSWLQRSHKIPIYCSYYWVYYLW